MVNDFGKAIAAFVAMPETKLIAQPKEIIPQIYKNKYKLPANINRKGAASHRKIGLPQHSLFL